MLESSSRSRCDSRQVSRQAGNKQDLAPKPPYFTGQEQAALALAEEVTDLPVPERRAWDTGVLTDEQVSAISWLTIVMNAWNRIAVTSHYPVAP